LHEAHAPPAQEPQPPLDALLATSRLPPPFCLLIAAKTEISRRDLALAQRGQAMLLSAWPIGRSASKRVVQSVHWYSYSGTIHLGGIVIGGRLCKLRRPLLDSVLF
jgi:hypothetical protein